MFEKENCCTCDEGWNEHPCPYRQDIFDDSETLCTCCPTCQQNCADDI